MALYLIIFRDDDNDTIVREIEAKNIKEVGRALVAQGSAGDGFTGEVWRVAGRPKTVTLKLTTSVEVEVSVDPGEDE